MSRLPRLRSSPDPIGPVPSITTTLAFSMSTSTLGNKRKADDDLDAEALDQPRKLPAIGNGAGARPLAASRGALNRPTMSTGPAAKLTSGPQRLTVPEPPKLSASAPRRTTRATSAPPKQSSSTGSVRPSGRIVSGSRVASRSGMQSKELRDLQSQVASIGSAQLTNAARLAKTMDAERVKVAELEANHRALSLELINAKSLELDKRRELASASDEIEKLRMKHAREIMELEMEVKSKTREARELADELRLVKGDLERERDNVSNLKATISHQSTSHITLNAQINALQAQNTASQMQLNTAVNAISDRAVELEIAQRRILELEQDARESEMVRRKLHNMVQELKGNIRVFCRVRPVLASDLTSPSSSTGLVRSGSSNNPTPDDEEKGSTADISFPDKRDHKEIIISSSSSSAMGSERKEVYNFGFDRVRSLLMKNTCTILRPFRRYLNLNQPRPRFSRKSPSLLRAVWMDITFVYSLMAKRAPASLSLWKADRCRFSSI